MPGARVQALKEALGASGQRVRAVISGLDDEEVVATTDNPSWRVRDILAHLVASEPGILANARAIAAGSGGVPADFRLDDWNARQVAKRADESRDDLFAQLAENRRKTLQALDELDERDLDRRGRHADLSDKSVEELFQTIARHEQGHLDEIERAVA